MKRPYAVRLMLSRREAAAIDERRGTQSRAAYLRDRIGAPASRDVLSHGETLGLLSERARAGSITAAVALERALRHRPTTPDRDAEFEREMTELLGNLPD